MDIKDYTEANRKAWNQAAPFHEKSRFNKLTADFSKAGHTCLDEIETAILKKIRIKGRAVAQLCCNNGRELLSIKNMGAGFCAGFDISDAFIDQAGRLAKAGNIDGTFIRSSVYEIPDEFNNRFDLVFSTIGALCWLPDIQRYFQVVRDLLTDNGTLFIYDMHPILWMFDDENKENPLKPVHSYFFEGVWQDDTGLDYYENTDYKSTPKYEFHHKMSDLISACLEAGFTIRSFKEYGHDISNIFKHLESLDVKPPLCYTLVAD